MSTDSDKRHSGAPARTRSLTAADRHLIQAFLNDYSTLTLATCGTAGPWAAALFFAHDERLDLYFISSPESRHARELLRDGRAAATVNGQHDDWSAIRGLQIAGRAERVTAAERPAVAELYLSKFEKLRGVLHEPADDMERRIGQAFAASEFFRLRPATVRVIDNRRGFGAATEFVLDA